MSWIHPGELLIENKRQSKTKEEETSSEKFFRQNILKENRQAELLFFKILKDNRGSLKLQIEKKKNYIETYVRNNTKMYKQFTMWIGG